MNPIQRILGGMNFGPFGDRGAINHHNGNAQVTRGHIDAGAHRQIRPNACVQSPASH